MVELESAKAILSCTLMRSERRLTRPRNQMMR
jgi:hypothetical protein